MSHQRNTAPAVAALKRYSVQRIVADDPAKVDKSISIAALAIAEGKASIRDLAERMPDLTADQRAGLVAESIAALLPGAPVPDECIALFRSAWAAVA